MKEKLFENTGGNSFRLAKENNMLDYGDHEPVDSGEDPTGDLEAEIDDLLAILDLENPDPKIYGKLMNIKNKLDHALGTARTPADRDDILKQNRGSIDKLSSLT